MAPPLRGTNILAQPSGLGPFAGQLTDILNVGAQGVRLAGQFQELGRRDERDNLIHDSQLFDLTVKQDIEKTLAGEEPLGFESWLQGKTGEYKPVTIELKRREYTEAVKQGVTNEELFTSGFAPPAAALSSRIVSRAFNAIIAPGGPTEAEEMEIMEKNARRAGLGDDAIGEMRNEITIALRNEKDKVRAGIEQNLISNLNMARGNIHRGINEKEAEKKEIFKLFGDRDPRDIDFGPGSQEFISTESRLQNQALFNRYAAKIEEIDFQIEQGGKLLKGIEGPMLRGNMKAAFQFTSRNVDALTDAAFGRFGEAPEREGPPPESILPDPDESDFEVTVGRMLKEGMAALEVMAKIKDAYAGTEDLDRAVERVEEITGPKKRGKKKDFLLEASERAAQQTRESLGIPTPLTPEQEEFLRNNPGVGTSILETLKTVGRETGRAFSPSTFRQK